MLRAAGFAVLARIPRFRSLTVEQGRLMNERDEADGARASSEPKRTGSSSAFPSLDSR